MQPGEFYHGLKLLRHCGSGAFGDVFYCEDVSGRRMAVKIVSKSRLANDWARELRGVINYRHITENAPELLQIFHVEEDEDTFFYTMEAADARPCAEYRPDTLAARIDAGALPEAELFPILNGIFSGICTIHRAGFAHRDVKPDNILFVKGEPKLGDIGLVSSLSASVSQLAGTLDFLPPEVRAADGAASTDRAARQRSDLYAFGKVIYCAVTGEESSNWPAVPKTLPLSLPLKLFLRLSFDLCTKEPTQRLADLDQVEHEMAEIQRKLITGETFRDRVRYAFTRAKLQLRGALLPFRRWRIWHFLILAGMLLAFGGIVWRLKSAPVPAASTPNPAPVPAEAESQPPALNSTLVNSRHFEDARTGLSMEIPAQWEIISPDMFDAVVDQNAAAGNPIEGMNAKQRAAFGQLAKMGVAMIVCDIAPDFVDNIIVYQEKLPGSLLLEMTDEQLRLYTRAVLAKELGMQLAIYDWKRTEIAGFPVIYVENSSKPETIRAINCVFVLEDRVVVVMMTARNRTFAELKRDFDAALETVKIDGKPAQSVKPSANPSNASAALQTTIPENGLVFFAPLQSQSASVVKGNMAYLVGELYFTTDSGIPCAYFDGKSYMIFPADAIPRSGEPCTVSLWMKCTRLARKETNVFSFPSKNIYLCRGNGNLSVQDGNGNGYDCVGNFRYDLWNHVVLKCSRSDVTVYVNGKKEKTFPATGQQSGDTGYVGTAYKFVSSNVFCGYLCGVRVYNRELSDAEISSLSHEFSRN